MLTRLSRIISLSPMTILAHAGCDSGKAFLRPYSKMRGLATNESTDTLSPESVSRVTSDISSPLESAILPIRFLGTFDMIFILYAVKSDTTVTAMEYFPSQLISTSIKSSSGWNPSKSTTVNSSRDRKR